MTRTKNMRGMTAVAMLFLPAAAFAAASVASVNAGGGRSASAAYSMEASLGDIGGVASGGPVSNTGGGSVMLPVVQALALTAAPGSISEGGTTQLGGTATMDDQTFTALVNTDITWDPVAYPLQSLDGNGVLTAVAHVYASPTGTVGATYSGVAGSTLVSVLGPYAGSSIPDAWYVQYFGVAPNPLADPTADTYGTGQNNLFKYVAGLDPTNTASRFTLDIKSIAGQSGQMNLLFSPRWNDRTYTLQSRTNLLSGSWQPVTATITNDNGLVRTITDLNATDKSRFYQMQISYP